MPKIIDNPREEILRKAKDILLEEGYQNLSIRKVAKECGFGVGTIYNYFPTKKDLIIHIMTGYWEEYFGIVEEINAMSNDFFEKLKVMYSQFESFVDVFLGIWVKINNDIVEEYNEDKLKGREDFNLKLIKKLETMLSEYYMKTENKINLELSTNDIAKFIVLNFVMMAQMKQFSYDSFEKIVIKLLK
ncbi:MAG: TetR/AcrR family transcriptional regulator [Clostridia bacterium]|nr:TetR/AcrR family transcriptional regulator [Clostridia bacterium]